LLSGARNVASNQSLTHKRKRVTLKQGDGGLPQPKHAKRKIHVKTDSTKTQADNCEHCVDGLHPTGKLNEQFRESTLVSVSTCSSIQDLFSAVIPRLQILIRTNLAKFAKTTQLTHPLVSSQG